MMEDFQYRTNRMQLLFEQLKWMIGNQQLGIELDELARRMQLGNWEAQHLFQEYLNKDPIRFIQDAFSPSLTQVEKMAQVSIFDEIHSEKKESQPLAVNIELIDSAEEIQYTKFHYFLGEIFMASTEKGICQLSFEDAENGLARLTRTFPKAILVEERISLHEAVFEVLNAYFSGSKKKHAPVPIAIKASAFQLAVWKELILLNPGELATYEMLTETLGDKNASRALRVAVDSNPVALLIPCHRVVKSNGKPGNFRWKTWRKQVLLAIEK